MSFNSKLIRKNLLKLHNGRMMKLSQGGGTGSSGGGGGGGGSRQQGAGATTQKENKPTSMGGGGGESRQQGAGATTQKKKDPTLMGSVLSTGVGAVSDLFSLASGVFTNIFSLEGIGGAAAGYLYGYYNTDNEKEKLRNALGYMLVGTLAGSSVHLLVNALAALNKEVEDMMNKDPDMSAVDAYRMAIDKFLGGKSKTYSGIKDLFGAVTSSGANWGGALRINGSGGTDNK
ncbi:MAG: hypothetical protein QXY62_04945 [Candidatus Altiarchaeota archaeon]